jgi:glycosyltransferase involved in cell wall biosynthesis
MSKKIKVLHVISNFGIGGAEVWLIALLRRFKEAAVSLPVTVETGVFLTNGVTDVLDDEARRLGANLFYSRYSRATLPRFVRDWRRCLAQGRYDAIHDHQEFTAGWHFLMGFGHLPKVRIAHLHNPLSHQQTYSESGLRQTTLKVGNWLVGKLGTHCLSTSTQLIMEQGFNSPCYRRLHKEAVYCGFDVDHFRGDAGECHRAVCEELSLPLGAKIMLFAGRLDSHEDEARNQKNPTFCLEVAKRCAESTTDFYCLVAGGGDRVKAKLEDRVKAWGLADRIRFLGRRPDIPRLMLAARVLLLPSIAEGLGMVAVEAQAAGLPVIASTAVPRECAVIPEIVRFLDLQAGSAAWSAQVLEVMSQLRPSIQKANARVQSSKFSIENSAARLLEIYRGRQGG